MEKNFIKSERTIYLLLGIISVILASIIFFFSLDSFNNFQFVKYKEFLEGNNFNVISYYYDLDNDGQSERIPIGYSEPQKDYFLQIFKIGGNFRGQFNFFSNKIYHFSKYDHKSWMTFEDWNEDGYIDIFVPSMDEDTLFLDIISAKEPKYKLKRRPIYFRKNIKKDLPWNIHYIHGKTLDVNNDGYKDLLLSFASGFSLQPRGFMTYDIKNDSIIDTFYTKASFADLTIADIDGDGEKEILCWSGTGGNYSDTSGFADNKAWFFVLNKDLSFKLPPRSYGRVQTSVKFTIVDSVIVLFAARINKNFDAVYERISNRGETLERKILKNFGAITDMKFIRLDGNRVIFLASFRNAAVKLFSADMNILAEKPGLGRFSLAADLTGDGVKEFIFRNKKRYVVTNQEFDILAELNLKEKSTKPEIVRLGKSNGIAIQTANANVIYQLAKSPLIVYFIPVILFSALILFLIFFGIHQILKQISIFYHTFLFFIQQDESSLLLLNSDGKVLRLNKQFEDLLLEEKEWSGKHYREVLGNYENIVDVIQEALDKQIEKQAELSVYRKDLSLKGKIEVIPFRAFLGYTFAYLVKIVDQTEEILNERIQVWSHTAQKIAHEIKTPLASIKLNLKALKKRLEKESKTDYEINDDIKTINQQIDRIKVLTSSFLKITNLEKSSIGLYPLGELINAAIEKFHGYLSESVNISIDETVKEINIRFDKNQFVEVIQIILENAIDALQGSGEIRIAVEEKTSATVELSITDFGKGIDSKNIQKVFDPYFTTKKDGTGLGLAFAKKIIEDNNSSIEIESEFGKWTKVKIKIQVE